MSELGRRPEIKFDEQGWDQSNDGWHRLHYAARYGDWDEIKTLIDKGESADLETKRHFRRAPLHLAARHNQWETIELLLEYKANVDKTDKRGWTALMCSALMGRRNCVEVLLTWNANREPRATSGRHKGHTALDIARTRWTFTEDDKEIVTKLEAKPAPEAPPAPFPAYE